MKIDKHEKFFWNKKKFEKVDEILKKEFPEKLKRGECFKYWARKKQLLKQMYNMDWKSPAELNKDIKFD